MKTEWVQKKLGELGSVNPNNREPIPDHFIYIDLESVVSGQLLAEKLISKKEAPSRAQRIVYFNDVLYQTVRPYQNNNYIHKKRGDYIASTGYALIRCYEDYDPDFVYYLLHTQHFESVVLGLCTGTSYPAIAPNSLKRIEVAVPSTLPAQRRIAAILSSADKVIASTQKVIAKYKQMKQGMMEDLLKPKEGWKKVKLGEVIVDSYAGGTPNRGRGDYFGGDIPWVSSGEVNNPEINSTFENITIEGLNNSSAKWIPENSILVALYGATAGQVSMLRIRATSNQAVLAIIPNDEVADTMFLYYQIVYNKENLLFLAQGSGQPNLSKNLVDKLEISIPDLTEQQRIASILSGIDAKIAAEETVLGKYGKIKKGMMERMLEGENNLN